MTAMEAARLSAGGLALLAVAAGVFWATTVLMGALFDGQPAQPPPAAVVPVSSHAPPAHHAHHRHANDQGTPREAS